MSAEGKIVVETARHEARRMREAIMAARGQDDAPVTLTMDQFRMLTDLIDTLARTVEFWPEDSLDDPRYWVPLGHFKRVKAEAAHWRAECDRLARDQPVT